VVLLLGCGVEDADGFLLVANLVAQNDPVVLQIDARVQALPEQQLSA
jgi:hypothetical protein